MEWWELLLGIPMLGIVFGVGNNMLKTIIASQERRLQMRLDAKGALSGGAQEQIEALRDEIMRLRDTTTQYDVSIQHTLEDLQRRVQAIEAKKSVGLTLPAESQVEQKVLGRQ